MANPFPIAHWQSPTQEYNIQIGSGAASLFTAETVPVREWYEYGWSVVIIPQTDINQIGDILSVSFLSYPASTTTAHNIPNQKIFMGHTGITAFPTDNVVEQAISFYGSGKTQVFGNANPDGDTITWAPDGTWQEVTLDTPFAYNNVDNLMIKWENRQALANWTSPDGCVDYICSSEDMEFYVDFAPVPGTRLCARDWDTSSYPISSFMTAGQFIPTMILKIYGP